MKKNTEEKTNVQRLLDGKKIAYTCHSYADTPSTNGVEIARILGEDERKVFKTLVTVSKKGEHYVFMVPVAEELDLKKAAQAASQKSIEMIPQKELLPLTGYVHGGCSPIGMKKQFATFIHESAEGFDTIIFSAGKVGYQVELPLEDLRKVVPVTSADLTVSKEEKTKKYEGPCCGYYTFETPDEDDHSICPVCFWERDRVQFEDEEFEGGANRPSLKEARENFLKYGACEEKFADMVREPEENEVFPE